jgi:phosphoribosyl 1,2-cyclic phosphodiesterase
VRGSTPCPSPANARYGGNTACVALEAPGSAPVVLDLGTGLRMWGDEIMASDEEPFHGSALVTHLHWDHVQGLPFFVPVLREGASLDVYGPVQDDGRTLLEAFNVFMAPPYFPVELDQLPGRITFHELGDEAAAVGDAKVLCRSIPHVGRTNGYRIEMNGSSVAYLSDHQQPADPSTVAPGVLELCDEADIVIHDAQYTPEEFSTKSDWGHCTVRYAVEVAHQSRAKRIVLFHHDPSHDDDTLDRLAEEAREMADPLAVTEVISAREGLTISLNDAAS